MTSNTKVGLSKFLFLQMVPWGIKLISEGKNLITLGHVGGSQVVHCHSGCPGLQQIFAGVPGKQLPMMALA